MSRQERGRADNAGIRATDERGEYFYRRTTLQRWLLAAGVLFAIAVALTLVQDYDRPWRRHQQRFARLETRLAREDIRRAAEDTGSRAAKLREKLSAETAERAGRTADMRAELRAAERTLTQATQRQAAARSRYEAARYRMQRAAQTSATAETAALQAELERARAAMEKDHQAYRAATEARDAAAARLKEHQEPVINLERQLARIDAARIAAEKRLAVLDAGGMQGLANVLRDMPLLDFISPTERIRQVTPAGIYEDAGELDVPRAERCISCHVAIDRPGCERLPNPYRTHPRLDLYVAADSPHSVGAMGCTICHGGNGHATDFVNAAHTPRSAADERAWAEKHGWRRLKHWPSPMLAMDYVHAGCGACHRDPFEIPGAPALSRAQALFERMGCNGCHQIDRVTGRAASIKAGPSLRYLSSKLTKDWALRWLRDPRLFRPDTLMPRVFHLENTCDGASRRKEDALIHAMVACLFDASQEWRAPGPAGSTAASSGGLELLQDLGCAGCHTIRRMEMELDTFGPELSSVGSKTNAAWLAKWMRAPADYWPDALMPSVRLNDAESSAIASTLAGFRDEPFHARADGTTVPTGFADIAVPLPDQDAVTELFHDYLGNRESAASIDRRIAAMDEQRRLVELGRIVIRHRGCAGCHEIPGFEKEGRIGIELSSEGTKRPAELDFGMLASESGEGADGMDVVDAVLPGAFRLAHTTCDWLEAKLRRPRAFDSGRIVPFAERLRMPQFDLPRQDVHDLVQLVLGFQRRRVSPALVDAMPEKSRVLAAGRATATRYNCTGCHQLGLAPAELPVETTDFDALRVWSANDVTVSAADPADGSTTGVRILARHEFVRGDKAVPRKDDVVPVADLLGMAGLTTVTVLGHGEGRIMPRYSVAAFGPPLLRLEGRKVLYDWLNDYLRGPYMLRPQIGIRMPSFGFGEGEVESLVGFFANASDEAWPLYHEETTHTAAQVRAGLETFGVRGTPGYSKTMQCNRCHPTGRVLPGADPSEWGPNLAMGQYRLKSRWIMEWLFDPQYYIPGTAMPCFFFDPTTRPPTPMIAGARRKMEDIVAYTKHMNIPMDEMRILRTDETVSEAATTAPLAGTAKK